VLAANEIYSRNHELRKLTPRPERRLAVLTCMDTRLSIRTLGLRTGDAHIIRNAGGIVTEDTLRSLVVSHYLLGTEEIMVINHTDSGLMHTSEQDLRTRIQNRTGKAAVAPAFFYAFQDIEENGRHQLQELRTHPWIRECRCPRLRLRRHQWTSPRNKGPVTRPRLNFWELPRVEEILE
jgi:carbonic anhydrase